MAVKQGPEVLTETLSFRLTLAERVKLTREGLKHGRTVGTQIRAVLFPKKGK
jgi:hypothetical protein